MLSYHIFALDEWSKVKSDTTKIFVADDFLKVYCTLQNSKTNNQWDVGNEDLEETN